MYLQCLWKDKDGSIITSSLLGLRSSGSCVYPKVIFECIWNWCVSGVKNGTVDFGAEIRSLDWKSCNWQVSYVIVEQCDNLDHRGMPVRTILVLDWVPLKIVAACLPLVAGQSSSDGWRQGQIGNHEILYQRHTVRNMGETKGNKTHTRGRFHHMVVVVYPLPWPLLVGGVRCSRLWSTSQLLRPSGQQCSHSGGVCPQIQGRQCGAYVGAVEEMMCVVCVDVTEGA